MDSNARNLEPIREPVKVPKTYFSPAFRQRVPVETLRGEKRYTEGIRDPAYLEDIASDPSDSLGI